MEGTSTYPDATFTLRLAFGRSRATRKTAKTSRFETTFAGMYKRSKEHDNKPPFDLPPRWIEKKDKLDLKTPLNFVCTADIIGGNSGSPVINKRQRGGRHDFRRQHPIVGAGFRLQRRAMARAVSVHSAGIIEALRKVYDANDLTAE